MANWICEASERGRREKEEKEERGEKKGGGEKERKENKEFDMLNMGPNDSIVIIGGDADLVVQCLALPSSANLFVYTPQNIANSKNTRGNYKENQLNSLTLSSFAFLQYRFALLSFLFHLASFCCCMQQQWLACSCLRVYTQINTSTDKKKQTKTHAVKIHNPVCMHMHAITPTRNPVCLTAGMQIFLFLHLHVFRYALHALLSNLFSPRAGRRTRTAISW